MITTAQAQRAGPATCRTSRPRHASEHSGFCHTHDHASALVRGRIYGARPCRSRFLQVDPIEGGSANDYDYVEGDPINAFDLDGMAKKCKTWDLGCKAKKFGKGVLKNRVARGIATGMAVAAVCSTGVGCALAVGAGVGGAWSAADYDGNKRRGGLGGHLAVGMISGAGSGVMAANWGLLARNTAGMKTAGQFLRKTVPGTITQRGIRARIWQGAARATGRFY